MIRRKGALLYTNYPNTPTIRSELDLLNCDQALTSDRSHITSLAVVPQVSLGVTDTM
jgi:hypothetical protein